MKSCPDCPLAPRYWVRRFDAQVFTVLRWAQDPSRRPYARAILRRIQLLAADLEAAHFRIEAARAVVHVHDVPRSTRRVLATERPTADAWTLAHRAFDQRLIEGFAQIRERRDEWRDG